MAERNTVSEGRKDRNTSKVPSSALFETFDHSTLPPSIPIIGETGSGKSTLVNNLAGEDVAKVGEAVESEKFCLTRHECKIKGVAVHIFDTRGYFCEDHALLTDLKTPSILALFLLLSFVTIVLQVESLDPKFSKYATTSGFLGRKPPLYSLLFILKI